MKKKNPEQNPKAKHNPSEITHLFTHQSPGDDPVKQKPKEKAETSRGKHEEKKKPKAISRNSSELKKKNFIDDNLELTGWKKGPTLDDYEDQLPLL